MLPRDLAGVLEALGFVDLRVVILVLFLATSDVSLSIMSTAQFRCHTWILYSFRSACNAAAWLAMVLFSAPDAAIGEIVYFTTAIEVINWTGYEDVSAHKRRNIRDLKRCI